MRVAELSSGLDSPCGLAFDSSGDVWTANESANTVVAYTPSQLLLGLPGRTLSSGPSDSLGSPCGLAFDSSGDLWVANESAGTVVEYTPGQLVSGAPIPTVTIASPGFPGSLGGPCGLAFDSSGDLWVANESANTVVDYTPGQLVTGSPVPSATIRAEVAGTGSSASLSGPRDLTFDASGDLWVANEEGDDLVEFAPDQLESGSPVPRATISSGRANGLSVPLGLAFDVSGDLWVTNEEGDDLVEYTPDQLVSGSPDPRVAASAANSGFDWPFGVAFDSSGDLWVANYSANSLVEFAPNQLTNGSPTPTATISSGSSGSLEGPDGLAFDRSGDLWVANYDEVTGADSLVEFAPNQLTTGSPTPTATISSSSSESLDEPQGLAFDSSGDLWVANDNANTVVELKPRQLVTGAPTPAVTVSSALSGSLDGPADLAFDASGDLWVANYNSDTVVEYSPGRLATGPQVPNETISSGPSNSRDGPDGLAFEPSGDLWVVNFNNNTAVEYALGP
jgi:secreted PhoX family phosphatase